MIDLRATRSVHATGNPRREMLVVDDVPEILEWMAGVSRRVRAFDVGLTAEVSAERALDLARTQRFDVVVTDFRMQGADGLDILTAAHRLHPEGRRVLMTGYNEVPAGLDRIQAAGIDAYVQKPLHSQDVLLLLIDMLRGDAQALAPWRKQARDLEAAAMRDERAVGVS